jgi:TRAP-type C4-dicarboxylate transport system permease small subunit
MLEGAAAGESGAEQRRARCRWSNLLVVPERALELLSAILVALSLVAVSVQVVMRYGFNHATTWSDTVASCSLAWIAFLSATAAVRSERNLVVRFVVLRLPPAVRRLTDTFCYLVIFLFAIVLTKSGIELMSLTAATQVEGLPFNVSWAEMYSISVASGILMALFALEHILRLWLPNTP